MSGKKKRERFVIYQSDNGGVDWYPIMPDKVPEWVKNPDVMGNLAAGRTAQYTGGLEIHESAAPMFRAERISLARKPAALKAANEKRARRRGTMH